MNLEERIRILEEKLNALEKSDRYTIHKTTQFFDGRNIQVGLTNGTKIATDASQKLGFYGVTPVVQQSAITAPSGGATQDAEARTAINSILTALQNLGLTA